MPQTRPLRHSTREERFLLSQRLLWPPRLESKPPLIVFLRLWHIIHSPFQRCYMRRKKSRHNMPIRDRFETFFHEGEKHECWEWQGAPTSDGYGLFSTPDFPKGDKAHRVSFYLYKGNISNGSQVLHECDNRLCVNPNHLHCGTNEQNQKEAWMRNRKTNVQKLSAQQVLEIKSSSLPQKQLAAIHGVGQWQISRIKSGKRGNGILLQLPPTGI